MDEAYSGRIINGNSKKGTMERGTKATSERETSFEYSQGEGVEGVMGHKMVPFKFIKTGKRVG